MSLCWMRWSLIFFFKTTTFQPQVVLSHPTPSFHSLHHAALLKARICCALAVRQVFCLPDRQFTAIYLFI